MRILHICLAGYYSVGWGYQDNLLAEQNAKDGHEVFVIASQYQRTTENEIEKVPAGEYKLDNGITVIRIPMKFEWLGFLKDKIRMFRGLYVNIERVKPDVVFVHCPQFLDFSVVGEYAKVHPDVAFYADNHASMLNSARNFLSRSILHRLVYRSVIRKNYWYLRKIFYVTYDTRDFLQNIYGIRDKLEFMPLCGTLYSRDEIIEKRKKVRSELLIREDTIVIIHCGKLNKEKKTIEVLQEFSKTKIGNIILIVIGSLDTDIRDEATKLMKSDKRIMYLGWKSKKELDNYLCASDILLQPGSQSVVFQQAIACGNMLILESNQSTEYLVSWGNGILLDSTNEISALLSSLSENQEKLCSFKRNSFEFAQNELNYQVQSRKFVE